MCYTSGTTGQPKGVVYSHRSIGAARARRRREQPARASASRVERRDPAGRADVPRERVGLSVHSRRCSARSSCTPARTSTRESLLDLLVAGEGRRGGRRADDLDGHPAAARRGRRRAGISRDEGDARRRLGGAARDDRRVRAAPRHPDHPGLGHDRDLAGRLDGARCRTISQPSTRRRGSTSRRWPGIPLAVRRGARPRGDEEVPVGRRGDGRARGARPVGRVGVLRHARAGRPLDGRRLVQDRRHRLDPPARLHPDQGPLEGRDQVGRRVDLVGRARERADGASRRSPRRR